MSKVRPITLSDSFLQYARVQLKKLLNNYKISEARINEVLRRFDDEVVKVEIPDSIYTLLEIAFSTGYFAEPGI